MLAIDRELLAAVAGGTGTQPEQPTTNRVKWEVVAPTKLKRYTPTGSTPPAAAR
jgi:hypothetical protein